MAEPTAERKRKESELAFQRLNYATQFFQNEVGRVWQRSLAFWGFVGAAFVAYGALLDKHNLVALLIACFGLVSSVCWTLVNRASRRSQYAWISKVDALEFRALKLKILKAEPEAGDQDGLGRLWDGARYSTTRLMIALSDATSIVWILLVCKSSIPYLKDMPYVKDVMSRSDGAAVALTLLFGTLLYVVAIFIFARSR